MAFTSGFLRPSYWPRAGRPSWIHSPGLKMRSHGQTQKNQQIINSYPHPPKKKKKKTKHLSRPLSLRPRFSVTLRLGQASPVIPATPRRSNQVTASMNSSSVGSRMGGSKGTKNVGLVFCVLAPGIISVKAKKSKVKHLKTCFLGVFKRPGS